MARRLKITMTARAVIARGFAFSPREGSFADADVARDELLSLPPPPEPLVLRVTAEGGRKAERTRVEGDWLCDATLDAPRRLPAPAWLYDPEAKAWSKKRPWLEAWETCEDARWMLSAAVTEGVDRRLVVRAACACARTVLDRVPAGEESPRRAIEVAEAWARGEATLDQVRQASNAAYAAYAAANAASAAATAASDAAYAAVGDAASAAAVAAYAAFYAASAAAASIAARQRVLARLADLVRGEIATWTVLRAAVQRAA